MPNIGEKGESITRFNALTEEIYRVSSETYGTTMSSLQVHFIQNLGRLDHKLFGNFYHKENSIRGLFNSVQCPKVANFD